MIQVHHSYFLKNIGEKEKRKETKENLGKTRTPREATREKIRKKRTKKKATKKKKEIE